MDLSKITPLILTSNEQANIGRALERLGWAERVVVIDSFSTDETLEICSSFPNVVVYKRYFDSFALQWNYGLSKVKTEWVLSLDADYICPQRLCEEIEHLPDNPPENGFKASFRYCVSGQPVRQSLYPPRTVLYRPDHAHYVQDGHTQVIEVDGRVGRLSTRIDHDDRKPLSTWFSAQQRFARDEVVKLHSIPRDQLGLADRIRLTGWLAPLLTPFFCLIVKGGLLDGPAGWFYALQRTYGEVVLALMLLNDGVADGPSEGFSLTAATRFSGDGSACGYTDFPHDVSQVIVTVSA